MSPYTPRHAAFVFCLILGALRPAAAVAADAPADPQVKIEVKKAFKSDPGLTKLLADGGYVLNPDRSMTKVAVMVTIHPSLLNKVSLTFDDSGRLVYGNGMPVEEKLIVGMLDGLIPFAQVQNLSAEEVGKVLISWGVPPVFNGDHLLNPDGSATYFGLMFYQGLKNKAAGGQGRPRSLGQLSGERLKKSLELFQEAYGQAFFKSAPDIAAQQLSRAWDMLGWTRRQPGETPLRLMPRGVGPGLEEYKKSLASGLQAAPLDPKLKAEMDRSLDTLKAMAGHRYHSDLQLPPPPGPLSKDGLAAFMIPPAKAAAPLHQSLLPSLLRTLDRLNGKPLSPAAKEWLVKSFPMGELVWRMGVTELWQDELAARQKVKVAVIDSGVAPHPDFADRLNIRANLTRQRGAAALGDHATHVAGIINALVGDNNVEMNSYRAIDNGSFSENPLLRDSAEGDATINSAIDRAVADGNQIINMSLGGRGTPNDSVAKKVEEYSKQGIIFVISAGNSAGTGVNVPSIAPSALTIGALNANGRLATFSSYGDVFDPTKLHYAIKKIFMAPGDDITSTMPEGFPGHAPYAKKSGTSMAAPAAAGIAVLLYQKAKSLNLTADPVALSRLVREALDANEAIRIIPVDKLPEDVPPEQKFVVVDPIAAYEALRAKAAVAKN